MRDAARTRTNGEAPAAPAAGAPLRHRLPPDDAYFVNVNQLMFTKSAELPDENTR